MLDKKISGESRYSFIENYLNNGFVYCNSSSNVVEGFYLPDYGGGLIIAENNIAGIELLKFRNKNSNINTVIPELNVAAKAYLTNCGFLLSNKAPRMYLGKEVNWKPEFIFSRGSGYAG